MKKSIESFAQLTLSRGQMKAIKGGITCTFTSVDPNVPGFSGSCASSSMDTCMESAGRIASNYTISSGGASVNYSCNYE